MKSNFLLFLFLLPLWVAAQKDKVVCDTLKADLDSGFVNKLKPDAHIDSLKSTCPVIQKNYRQEKIQNAAPVWSMTG